MGRLVGDARPSWLYDKRFRDWEEANAMMGIVLDCCPALSKVNGNRPTMYFTGNTNNLRRHGFYNSKRNEISISKPTWGILCHELAHLVGGLHHNYEFKEKHMELLEFMEALASS